MEACGVPMGQRTKAVDDEGSSSVALLNGAGWQNEERGRRTMCSRMVLPDDVDDVHLAEGVAAWVSADHVRVEQLEREKIAKKAL